MAQHWQSLVDLQKLAAWMDLQGLGSGTLENVHALTGGTQNVLLRFRRGAREFVLRRPPAHPIVDGTKTMRREARVLAALAGTSVPHPRLIAVCAEPSVLGAAFYLMEPVNGFSPIGGLPPSFADRPQWRTRMGEAIIDALAELASVDHSAVGLGDFARIEDYHAAQIARWRNQFESYRQFEGWSEPTDLRNLALVSAWLERRTPETFRPGLVHGDYTAGNIMFRHDRPVVAAIVDWELATLGDPLMDLGWLLATWPDARGASTISTLEIHPWQGLPDQDALTARYIMATGRDRASVTWFTVLACFKLCVLLEGTHARACAGKAALDLGQELHAAAVRVLARASAWITGDCENSLL